MVVVWVVIGVVVVIGTLLAVLEARDVRRRRALAHLEPVDPRIAERAAVEAESAYAIAQGTSGAAHPGVGGGAGTLGGS